MRSTSSTFLICIGVLFGVYSARPATGQVLQTAYDFQTIQPHPYVHALGNATVAARGYPGAVGVNPATAGRSGTVQFGSNVNLSQGPVYSSPWIFSDSWITAPSATVKMGRWAAGIQIKHFDWGGAENFGICRARHWERTRFSSRSRGWPRTT